MKHIVKISPAPLRKIRLKSFTLIATLLIAAGQQVLGQISDDFTDGDFTANPVWVGNDSKFVIYQNQLRLQAPAVSGEAYLVSVNKAFYNASWEFFVTLEFNPSNGNYLRVYLSSDQANLTGSLNGYFVMIGDTPDEVSLYRQTGNIKEKIIDGPDGRVGFSIVNIKIKVTRDALGNWELFSDVDATGTWTLEGVKNDITHASSDFFGVHCVYTSTRSDKFFFDDFTVAGEAFVDVTPPEVRSVVVSSQNTIEVEFSESIDETTAERTQNYFVSHGIGNPQTATLQANDSSVILVFSSPFPNGIERTLNVENISDINTNTLSSTTEPFLFFQPVPTNSKDIIITEIFSDPSPSVTLPEAEFIELYNRSEHPFDLAGWKFTDGISAGNLSSLILLPGQYLILCSTSAKSQFDSFGKALGLSPFPSLNNSGDFLVLKDQTGKPVDSVAYSSAWYKNEDKEDGGWSLELIDPDDFCKGSLNWTSSMHEAGGTPGQQNSVFAQHPDVAGPRLVAASFSDQNVITLEFDESLDKVLPLVGSFVSEPPIEITELSFSDDSFSKISLSLLHALDSAVTYNITLQNIFDCPGNLIQAGFSTVVLKLDTINPEIQSIQAITQNEIEITFTEKLSVASAENILHYDIPGIGNPSSAILQADQKMIRILFAQSFTNGVENTIHIQNVQDRAGNVIETLDVRFMFFDPVAVSFKDVIISEIFADPSPLVGLPEVEYVEFYNRSNHPFDLYGWKFSDGTSSVNLSSTILLPKEYLIICTQTKASEFLSKGKTLGLAGFPSLNNTGEVLVLTDQKGQKIDSVNYSITWYKDDEKKDGGWSLEIIDTENLCAESENWIASEEETGGTPGGQNSVFANKPDLTGPKLLSAVPVSDSVLLLRFDEKLDKILPSLESFTIEPQTRLSDVSFSNASLTTLYLVSGERLQGGKKYQLNVQHIYDCAGNILQEEFSRLHFALPENAQESDLLINEILFNPRPTGVDFVEVYNRSEKFLNLKNWQIANLENDSPVNMKIIFDEDFLLEPAAYVVFTEEGNVLKGEYLNAKEETFVEIDLPSFPDDEGSVALLDDAGEIIDSFVYSDRYHSVFIKDDEGVSLERVGLPEIENEAQNWKSASSNAGYATPGYLNSNSRTEGIADEAVQIEPEIFIPVNGQPDFAQIKYAFEQGGYIANVKILDRQGREIKILANNELLGTDGFFRWDGDQDNGSKARIGAYMVWFEVFDSRGDVKTFKKRVVIAGQYR